MREREGGSGAREGGKYFSTYVMGFNFFTQSREGVWSSIITMHMCEKLVQIPVLVLFCVS